MRLIDADALEKRFEYLTPVGNDLVHKVTDWDDAGLYLDSGNDLFGYVEAWMPLPEPYKEDEHD